MRAITTPFCTRTSPSSACSSPAMSFIRVDLPSPLRPTMHTRSLRSIDRSTCSSRRGPPIEKSTRCNWIRDIRPLYGAGTVFRWVGTCGAGRAGLDFGGCSPGIGMNRWNERYAGEEFLFGTAPNAFLVAQRARLPQHGKALAVADGEGRNGVWLRSEEHTSELQSHVKVVCRRLLEKKKGNPSRR